MYGFEKEILNTVFKSLLVSHLEYKSKLCVLKEYRDFLPVRKLFSKKQTNNLLSKLK